MPILLIKNKHCLHLPLCFGLRMSNIIELNLNYILIDQRKLCHVKLKQTNQIAHVKKLANQSLLNKAHVIEITKACTVAFIKARNFISCSMKRETCQLEKNPGDWEIFFFNALANRF